MDLGRIWASQAASAVEFVLSASASGKVNGQATPVRRLGFVYLYVLTFDESGLVETGTQYFDSLTFLGQVSTGDFRLPVYTPPVMTAPPFGSDVYESQGGAQESANLAAENAAFAAWNRHDEGALSRLLSADVRWKDYSSAGVAGRVDTAPWKAFPDQHVAVTLQFAAGEYVVSVVTCTGTWQETFLTGLVPGKKFTQHAVIVDHYKAGKMDVGYLYGNGLEPLGQLGIVTDTSDRDR